jgi:hypothetical protein
MAKKRKARSKQRSKPDLRKQREAMQRAAAEFVRPFPSPRMFPHWEDRPPLPPQPPRRPKDDVEYAADLQKAMAEALTTVGEILGEADRHGFIIMYGPIERHEDGGGVRFLPPSRINVMKMLLGKKGE